MAVLEDCIKLLKNFSGEDKLDLILNNYTKRATDERKTILRLLLLNKDRDPFEIEADFGLPRRTSLVSQPALKRLRDHLVYLEELMIPCSTGEGFTYDIDLALKNEIKEESAQLAILLATHSTEDISVYIAERITGRGDMTTLRQFKRYKKHLEYLHSLGFKKATYADYENPSKDVIAARKLKFKKFILDNMTQLNVIYENILEGYEPEIINGGFVLRTSFKTIFVGTEIEHTMRPVMVFKKNSADLAIDPYINPINSKSTFLSSDE